MTKNRVKFYEDFSLPDHKRVYDRWWKFYESLPIANSYDDEETTSFKSRPYRRVHSEKHLKDLIRNNDNTPFIAKILSTTLNSRKLFAFVSISIIIATIAIILSAKIPLYMASNESKTTATNTENIYVINVKNAAIINNNNYLVNVIKQKLIKKTIQNDGLIEVFKANLSEQLNIHLLPLLGNYIQEIGNIQFSLSNCGNHLFMSYTIKTILLNKLTIQEMYANIVKIYSKNTITYENIRNTYINHMDILCTTQPQIETPVLSTSNNQSQVTTTQPTNETTSKQTKTKSVKKDPPTTLNKLLEIPNLIEINAIKHTSSDEETLYLVTAITAVSADETLNNIKETKSSNKTPTESQQDGHHPHHTQLDNQSTTSNRKYLALQISYTKTSKIIRSDSSVIGRFTTNASSVDLPLSMRI